MGRSCLFPCLAGSSGRGDKDYLVVGLGSGTIHITGLVKHSFVRQQFDRQAFRVSVQRPSAAPSPGLYTHYYYDRHSVWLDFPGNAHDTMDETSPLSYHRIDQPSNALPQHNSSILPTSEGGYFMKVCIIRGTTAGNHDSQDNIYGSIFTSVLLVKAVWDNICGYT